MRSLAKNDVIVRDEPIGGREREPAFVCASAFPDRLLVRFIRVSPSLFRASFVFLLVLCPPREFRCDQCATESRGVSPSRLLKLLSLSADRDDAMSHSLIAPSFTGLFFFLPSFSAPGPLTRILHPFSDSSVFGVLPSFTETQKRPRVFAVFLFVHQLKVARVFTTAGGNGFSVFLRRLAEKKQQQERVWKPAK